VFRTGHGRKKFKAVHTITHTKECIIVAKAAKKDKEVKDEELAALEDADADEDVEDADVVEEKPKKSGKGSKKASGKGKGGESKPSRSRTTDGKVGTREIAEAAGLEGTSGTRTLRMVLRKHAVEKDPETGRYEWDSLKDPTVKKILKWIAEGEAETVKQEGLDRLKAQQQEKREAKKAKKAKKDKSGKKSKKSKKSDDDE
jgi:hypothetical protein